MIKVKLLKPNFHRKLSWANMFSVFYVLGRTGSEVIGSHAEQVQLPFRQLIAVLCLYHVLCNVNELKSYPTSGVEHPKLADIFSLAQLVVCKIISSLLTGLL